MVSKKDIDIYRDIKAPSELRDRVMNVSHNIKKENKLLYIKTLSTIAACLMVFAVGSFLLNRPADIDEYYVVDYSAASITQRMVDTVTVVFEGEGRISAEPEDQGFSVKADGTEIPLESKKNVNNKLELVWTVSDTPAFVRVNGDVYEVKYDSSLGGVTVNKIEK